MTDVRCPECARLLAKRDTDGSLLIRYRDRYAVVVKVGGVTCIKCQQTVAVGESTVHTTGTWGSRAN